MSTGVRAGSGSRANVCRNCRLRAGSSVFHNRSPTFTRLKINLPVSKMEPPKSHLVNPAPLLVLGILSGVKNNAVSRFDLHLRIQLDIILSDFPDEPDKSSALLAASPVDQSLMVDSVQPTGEQAPGKSHLETIQIVFRNFARLRFQTQSRQSHDLSHHDRLWSPPPHIREISSVPRF